MTNPWLHGIEPIRDGLLNWRHAAAEKLDPDDREPVMRALMPVLDELLTLTRNRVLSQALPKIEIVFEDWLKIWLENFAHWHDPVRAMLRELLLGREGPWFVETLTRADGIVLLDWMLANYANSISLRSLRPDEPQLPSLVLGLFGSTGMRSVERYALGAYQAFRTTTDRRTADPPSQVTIERNFDRLYER